MGKSDAGEALDLTFQFLMVQLCSALAACSSDCRCAMSDEITLLCRATISCVFNSCFTSWPTSSFVACVASRFPCAARDLSMIVCSSDVPAFAFATIPAWAVMAFRFSSVRAASCCEAMSLSCCGDRLVPGPYRAVISLGQ